MNGETHAVAAAAAGVVGLVAGSFAGVLVDRVPRGESIVSPASHCDSCDRPLRAIDNVPLVSYALLRGRCRDCRAPISVVDPLVELVTAGLFVLLAFRLPTLWALPAYCVLTAGFVALSAIDFRLRRLPTPIIYCSAAITVVLLAGASALTGDWKRLLDAGIGGAGCFVVFFLIFFAAPKAMGFGDVRLAAMCGVGLGWIGLREVPLGVLLGLLIAGVPAIVLLALGRANRKSQFAFGPFLAAGALVGICFGPAIASTLRLF